MKLQIVEILQDGKKYPEYLTAKDEFGRFYFCWKAKGQYSFSFFYAIETTQGEVNLFKNGRIDTKAIIEARLHDEVHLLIYPIMKLEKGWPQSVIKMDVVPERGIYLEVK